MKKAHFKMGIIVIAIVIGIVAIALSTANDNGNHITGADVVSVFDNEDEFKNGLVASGIIEKADEIRSTETRDPRRYSYFEGADAASTDYSIRTATLNDGRTVEWDAGYQRFFVYEEGAESGKVYTRDGVYTGNRRVPSDDPEAAGEEPGFFENTNFFANSGIGFYSQYIFGEEFTNQWREAVDRQFASLYLGTEYWASEICAMYIDRDQEGIAYFNTQIGYAGVAAHIEATRSQPTNIPVDPETGLPYDDNNGSLLPNRYGIIPGLQEYLYKITFNVKNGDYEDDPSALAAMRFNVMLKGSRGQNLYEEKIEIGKGESFGAAGSSAIVQYSTNFYDTICIVFDQVPSKWTLNGNELCNVITPPPTEPTSLVDENVQIADEKRGIVVVNNI